MTAARRPAIVCGARPTVATDHRIVPFESAMSVSNPAQVFVHGPRTEEAHSTRAVEPGWRFVHTSRPLAPNEAMTGVCPEARALTKASSNTPPAPAIFAFPRRPYGLHCTHADNTGHGGV